MTRAEADVAPAEPVQDARMIRAPRPRDNFLGLSAKVLGASAAVLLAVFFLVPTTVASDLGNAAQVLAALVSALAFAGFIRALALQREDLESQREELIATREEIREQRKQMELQNETLRRQLFEGTFFQLVRLHHDIVGSAAFENQRGRMVFAHFAELIQNHIVTARSRPGVTEREATETGFSYIRSSTGGFLPNYLQNLIETLQMIEYSGLDARTRLTYGAIMRAQLSTPELILIFYLGLTPDWKEIHPLAISHRLFAKLRPEHFKIPDHAKAEDLYAPVAFGAPGDWERRFRPDLA